MDKKISEKDKHSVPVLEFDRNVSFIGSIKEFCERMDIPLKSEGVIDYEKGDEKYYALAVELNNEIEMGYFNINPGREMKIVRHASNQLDTIALTFNFGANYEQQINDEDQVAAEGVVNSLVVNNFGIKTTTTIRKGNSLHALVIRYKKQVLKKVFHESDKFISDIVESDRPLVLFEDLNAPIMNALRSLELYKIPEVARNPYLIGKSYVLMALVVDLLAKRQSKAKMNMNSNEYQSLLTVRRFITRDWKNPPTIKVVSEYLGMSPTKAKVLFKQMYGMPIYEYFNRKRMEEAMKLIEKREMTVAEIGRELGYRNLGHFAEAFKKRYGILPKKLSMASKK